MKDSSKFTSWEQALIYIRELEGEKEMLKEKLEHYRKEVEGLHEDAAGAAI